MKIPNAEQAVVPEAKITRYLLDLTSPRGKAKAIFFLAFGFNLEQWEVMVNALKQHANAHEIASTRQTQYGVHYSIEGALSTPDGRNPAVRVIWKIEHDDTRPSLVTAYPL